MSDTIIACENLRDEIELVLKDLNINPNISWIDSQLHNVPSKLNKKLQEEIDKIDNSENILLLFGCCGNGTVGLQSKNAKIICPKVDDCISLYLGGNKKRKNLNRSTRSYFFTKRYIEHELSLWNEIENCKLKYGYEQTEMIYNMIFDKYEYIRVIDTSAYNVEDVLDKTQHLAKEWNLNHEIVKGDLSLFYKALNKEWDCDFIKLEKGETIKFDDFI